MSVRNETECAGGTPRAQITMDLTHVTATMATTLPTRLRMIVQVNKMPCSLKVLLATSTTFIGIISQALIAL